MESLGCDRRQHTRRPRAGMLGARSREGSRMDRLPQTADAIDAAWLERALAARYSGVRVAGVLVVARHEATNGHALLRVGYDEPAGAPEAMFCKLLPSDPARRPAIARTGMGRREA